MAHPGALLVVMMMCCACSLYPSIYLGIERTPNLLLVLAAVVGGGEQGGGVMTFAVFAGNPCYGGERQLLLPYFFRQSPLDDIFIIKVIAGR